jgi:intracellular multiplication protein IcmK
MIKQVLKVSLSIFATVSMSCAFAQEASAPVTTTTTTAATTTTTTASAPAASDTFGAPTPPPPSPPPPPPSDMSLNQFQQWVENKNAAGTAEAQNVTSHGNPTPPPVNSRKPRVMSFEESQQAMLNSTPPVSMQPSEDSEAAFSAMMQQNMPLTPRQVVKLRQQIDVSQRAAAITPTIPPKPVSTTLMINLAPGTTPTAVRLAQGYVSSLVFVDSTGSPWPIAAFDIGNPGAVNMQWDGKSNILLIQGKSPYMTGDIVIRLVGLPTPITLELVSGQRVVDYRVDLHVSGIGPNTKELPIGTNLPNSANQLLLGVLDGVAPAGSRTLMVHGADAQAWMLGERMYLRTRFTLLSPGWVGTMTSPDGMHAYELSKTSSVLVSKYGEPAELKIEGF